METTNELPIQRHDDSSVLLLVVLIALTVFLFSLFSSKQEPETARPPTNRELRFKRAKALYDSRRAKANGENEKDEKSLSVDNEKEVEVPISKSVVSTQTTIEKDLPANPHKKTKKLKPTLAAQENSSDAEIDVKLNTDKIGANNGQSVASIEGVHHQESAFARMSKEEQSPPSTSKKHQVAHELKDAVSKKLKSEKLMSTANSILQSCLLTDRTVLEAQPSSAAAAATTTTRSTTEISRQSRLLAEPAAPEGQPSSATATTTAIARDSMAEDSRQSRILTESTAPEVQSSSSTLAAATATTSNDPPQGKKRARKKVVQQQILSDMLSSITRHQVVVVDDKEYRPRKSSSSKDDILKILLAEDQNLSIVKIPCLPKTFRDLSSWFSRTHAISRNGFPPYMTSAVDEGYDDFQLLLSNLMNELAQEALGRLEKDQGSFDDEEDEDDLFTSYIQPSRRLQASSQIVSFLALLEETPAAVGRPFLDHILKKNSEMASTLLQRALVRLDEPPSLHLIPKRATAVSTLMQSPLVVQSWTKRIQYENGRSDAEKKNGKEMEATSWLKPLLRACAHCIPEAGVEAPTAPTSQFRRELEQLDSFPTSMYDDQNKELGVFLKQSQSQMQAARNVAESVLRKCGKQHLFQWLSQVVQANDAMGSMLRGDLLVTNGVSSVSSSRGFILGLASSVIGICGDSLVDLFVKEKNAFDYRYLTDGRLDVAREELMLVRNKRRPKSEQDMKFSGGSEFFFLTCNLLRVSLYPALRIESAFLQHYNQIFSSVGKAHNDKTGLSPHFLSVAKPAMAALIGWKSFLDDPDLVAKLTKFAILQLQWVLTQKDNFEVVPEWMCKNPATWLAHVAQTLPRLLRPYQAAATIECATQLLQAGTKANDDRALSPVVIDDLVKIVAGFVNAGVSRAKQKQKRRGGDFDIDRDASLYLSFDQNDLGVTVFTNELVSKELCPTLMQTFGAVDVVEGLDVDREHGFDKFSAKGRIAELFLRLWSHPNGECRASVVRIDAGLIAQFAKEIEIAIGVLFDFSVNRMADICNGSKQQVQSHRDKAFLVGQGRSVSSELYCARLWILLLCKISEEPRIRQILGSSSLSTDLAALMIHFVDILTDPDGGIHQSLDFARERSSDLAARLDVKALERQKHAADIAKARYMSRFLYGLDVASLVHQFMALLSCWHKQSRGKEGQSSILIAFAGHDDYEEHRYRNVVRRLIADKHAVEGSEGDCAETIFEHDGYVDVSAWKHNYRESLEKSADTESQIRTAKKDNMTREQIQILASVADISAFLDDAETFKAQSVKSCASAVAITPGELNKTTEALLTAQIDATLETYSDKLSDWLVSSENFTSPQDDLKFAHYYDGTARTRNVACSGKIMVKEARRCHKNLPVPHPNSAAFCCFAEERMDLCRACISGPIDTPYAHGIFVFEVFFPANYPIIPPLVTFMTTGGGQTRFNPNLYSDGKVCLSLLGTFHAQDESQKWNPGYSSLAQILLSIQTQLFVEEPYFNEPGNEARQGTPVGRESSTRYNLILQLATLRHAILAPLKEPPVGLEEICARHFSLCRRRIVVQAHRWMLEAKTAKSTLLPRFERAYVDLVTLLAAKYDNGSPSLPPCEPDVKALQKMGALLKGLADLGPDEKKKRARPHVLTARVDPPNRALVQQAHHQEMSDFSLAAALMIATSVLENNPWANPAAAARSRGNETTDDADDAFYE